MKIKIAMLVSAVISVCALMAGAVSYSWFSGSSSIESGIDASAVVSYFGGGDGTKDDPYIIRDPRHLYNLSWLQNMGVFQDKVYYFKLDSSFSMPKNSAVPPIGTTDYPFMGVFDGNKQTISDIWVSSDPNDWAKRPVNYESISMGKDIGFFGKIQKGDSDSNIFGGVVKSFYLNGLKVTSNIDDSFVGLIAGDVNGTLTGVGVKDGSFEFDNTDINDTNFLKVESNYTLIGNIDNVVDWADKPGMGGSGDLKIVPNIYSFSNLNNGSQLVCIGAQKDKYNNPTAYIIGGFTRYKPNPVPSAVYKYNDTNLSFGKTYSLYGAEESTKIIKGSSDDDLETEFWNSYGTPFCLKSTDGNKNAKTEPYPVFPSTPYAKPTNCIWFKPITSGKCTVAFAAQNMSNDGAMSIYRYKRDSNGIIISPPEEMRFVFVKNNSNLNNGAVVYFTFSVSDGYEYAIGKDSKQTNTNVGFLFLKLAGTSIDPGNIGPEKRVVLNVDYMENIPVLTSEKDVWDSEYKVKDILLKTDANIELGESKTASYYFDPNDHIIHYLYEKGINITKETESGVDDTK